MDQLELRYHEQKLRAWKGKLEEQLQLSDRSTDDDGGSPVPQSAGMAGSLEHIWRQAVRVQAKEIDRALDRIRTGVYGACEHCGDPISPRRLEVIPWARKCFACQSAAPPKGTTVPGYYAAPRWHWPS